ncbi:MAG: DNA primase [Actinophytocola sp.]|nr:DNA primase [Actinophytocola sp.]
MDTREHLTVAALGAVERGWHVFPLLPNGKRPALHGHDTCPGTGPCADGHRTPEQRATTDPARICAAWAHKPYNIGIATGPSGLCVLDLDTLKHQETVPDRWAAENATSGEDVLAILATDAGEELPGDTLTVRTASGGLHLYFTAPAGIELRNTSGEHGRGLGWKIDTRAWGGYVVAAGSITPAGTYQLVYDGHTAPLPGWLADRLNPTPPPPAPVTPIRPRGGQRSRYVEAAVRAETAKVHHAAKGQRNAALYGAAVALGQLVAGGALTADEHEAVLLRAAGRHITCRAYSEHEARRTIASGLRAGANRPRRIA